MNAYKQYPPILAGTTPPFYATGTGTYTLQVPFTMNKMVSISDVGGVKLRIRAADTDLEIGRLDAYSHALSSEETSTATFDLTPIVASIHIGKFYKIQLAYIDTDGTTVGYYSTISITKCTAMPTVTIMGMDRYNTNVDVTSYTGLYSNINDPTEKCYQYKFSLYDSENNLLDTSDWCLHNANSDDLSIESNDYYMLNYTCEASEKYKLQYSVITNNNLQIDSPMYMIVGSTSIAPELKANLMAEIDYDNGCVNLSLEAQTLPKAQQQITTYTGQFVITRSSSREDFKSWTKIVTFQLTGTLPQGSIYTDFTIEQGQTYRYALQQFNDNKIYSSRVYTEDVYAAFEDAFLYDGERQLRIRFNPKVSSFKTVLQDSKKNTLGSKYPFFFRNGNVAYKEFPISGLISYMIDENEHFLSRTKDLGMDIDWQDTFDIIDENIAYERKFKMAVMDWLNDGKPKLFRSPGEGNYIVRLTNVTLTPNDSLSRMIHTFQCTADEIDTFNPRKLVLYNFLKVTESAPLELRFGSISFAEMIQTYYDQLVANYEGTLTEEVKQAFRNQSIAAFENTDLLSGHSCQYLKFEDCEAGRTWFTIGGSNDFVIGATGQYENTFDTPVTNLKIKTAWFDMPGTMTYGIWTTQTSTFDTVSSIKQRDVVATLDYLGVNYIEAVENTKNKIQRFYGMHFLVNDMVYTIGSWEEFCEMYNLYIITKAPNTYDVVLGLSASEYNTALRLVEEDGTLSDAEKNKLKEELQSIRDTVAEWNEERVIQANTDIIRKGTARIRYDDGRVYSDILVDNALFLDLSTGNTYKFDKTNYEFTLVASETKVYINTYDPSTKTYMEEQVNLSPTQVCIDDDIIDLAETGYLDVPATDTIPRQIFWGTGISCTFIYQLITIGYGVESQVNPGLNQTESLVNAWTRYSLAAKYYTANILGFVRINTNAASFVSAVPDSDYDECSYFIWNSDQLYFERIPRESRSLFKNTNTNEVWIPQPYAASSDAEGGWVPSGAVFDGTTAATLTYKPYHLNRSYGNQDWNNEYVNAKNNYFRLLEAELAVQEKKLVLKNE